MTHKELHNNMSINVKNKSDALIILSRIDNMINATINGQGYNIVEMVASVMDNDPILKDIITTAIELSETQNNSTEINLN